MMGETTMFIEMKIALATALIVGIASAALANDAARRTGSMQSGPGIELDDNHWHEKLSGSSKYGMDLAQNSISNACPTLEGYPGCH
jgi:hypothetical protein